MCQQARWHKKFKSGTGYDLPILKVKITSHRAQSRCYFHEYITDVSRGLDITNIIKFQKFLLKTNQTPFPLENPVPFLVREAGDRKKDNNA
jgi:hypothetical protein